MVQAIRRMLDRVDERTALALVEGIGTRQAVNTLMIEAAIRSASRMLASGDTRPIIARRLMTRYGISQSGAYRRIQAAIEVNRPPLGRR